METDDIFLYVKQYCKQAKLLSYLLQKYFQEDKTKSSWSYLSVTTNLVLSSLSSRSLQVSLSNPQPLCPHLCPVPTSSHPPKSTLKLTCPALKLRIYLHLFPLTETLLRPVKGLFYFPEISLKILAWSGISHHLVGWEGNWMHYFEDP